MSSKPALGPITIYHRAAQTGRNGFLYAISTSYHPQQDAENFRHIVSISTMHFGIYETFLAHQTGVSVHEILKWQSGQSVPGPETRTLVWQCICKKLRQRQPRAPTK